MAHRSTSSAAAAVSVAMFLVLPSGALGHTIPDDVAVQIWAKPTGQRLHLLVRIPFTALADMVFPVGPRGELELPQVEAILPDAAKTWISDWIDLYEGNMLLAKPQIVATRVSLASDSSFASYEEAWSHLGSKLQGSMEVFPYRAMVDVRLDYPIGSDRSDFAIHSRLSRLGVRVVTVLRFLPPGPLEPSGEALRTFGYIGDPGGFKLNPRGRQAVERFLPLGFLQILKGSDYLLFLFCVALLFRSFRALIPFVAAFTVGYSITLIASTYNLTPETLWFPVLFETLIALSIVYLALDNIVAGTPARFCWIVGFGFGLVYGFGFSFALRPALQFAGTHRLAALLSFNVGIELGQFLVLALLIPMLTLLFRARVPERLGTIFLAALAAHTGWHRMLDRAQWLNASQFPWPALDPALWTAASRWTIASLIFAGLVYLFVGVLRRYGTIKA